MVAYSNLSTHPHPGCLTFSCDRASPPATLVRDHVVHLAFAQAQVRRGLFDGQEPPGRAMVNFVKRFPYARRYGLLYDLRKCICRTAHA